MRGIVIHHRGGLRRAIEGRSGGRRLSVRPILAVPSPGGGITARPVCLVFEEGSRVIASSSRVLLMRGRRYPAVEHWFVLPDEAQGADTDPQAAGLSRAAHEPPPGAAHVVSGAVGG